MESKHKVVGMWLLIQQQQIVIVGNHLARKKHQQLSAKLWSGITAKHQWTNIMHGLT